MIIGIAGRKQAGKTTVANTIHGEILLKNDLVKAYDIDEQGRMIIRTTNIQGEEGWGQFDIERKDEDFVKYAHYNMWPHVKLYNFADSLKNICMNLFDVPRECLYGTDEEKNKLQEHLLWENMSGVVTEGWLLNQLEEDFPVLGLTYHKPGPMTAREFMQYMGTDVMRNMYLKVWANSCLNTIQKEGSDLAIVADVRFPNEVEAINNAGGKVIKLLRDTKGDDHASETALDQENYDQSNFWHILDNKNSTIPNTVTDIRQLLETI